MLVLPDAPFCSDHRRDSAISCAGDDDISPPCRNLSSQGVRVSRENVSPVSPLRPTRADSCESTYGGSSRRPMVDAAVRAPLNVPGKLVRGSRRLLTWRRFEVSNSNGGISGSIPRRFLRRQRGNKSTIGSCRTTWATSGGTDTDVMMTAAASMPQVIQCIRAQISIIFRDRTYPPAAPAARVVCPISAFDSVTNSPELTATAHEPSAPPLPRSCLDSINNSTPEYFVAGKLQDNNSEETVCDEPASPATSSASDVEPCWAERSSMVDGMAATSSVCCSTDPSGHSSAVVRLKAERDAPRFLWPAFFLVMLSVFVIVGTRVGRGVGTFAPVVYAAEGHQVPEAVVDGIFDRADKDNDGVIADEEIQYVSLDNSSKWRFRQGVSAYLGKEPPLPPTHTFILLTEQPSTRKREDINPSDCSVCLDDNYCWTCR